MPHPRLHDRARHLRNDATPAERTLWQALRNRSLGAKFRRQHPVLPYVADFACVELSLIVELDGGQHGPGRDSARDAALAAAGWQVLRFWNNEVVENLDGVLQRLVEVIAERSRAR